MDVTSSTVEFQGGNAANKTGGFLVRPSDERKYPAAVVIHEIWGLVDHIRDVTIRLAREGYVALAIDLFEGQTVTQLTQGREIRQKFTEEKILADLNGAFSYLESLRSTNSKRIGSIGFCMGGGLSLLLACHNLKLAAAVIFYGRNPSPIDLVQNVACPILGNYAGADQGITEADVNLLKETLAKYGKVFDIKTYPGMSHAFFNDTRESYRPEAARDAWKRTLAFYAKYLKA